MSDSLKLKHFSVPVVAYNSDTIICDENDLALRVFKGVSHKGRPLVDLLNALPETHTTHILFEQDSFTVLELTEVQAFGRMSGVLQIEHELITPLDRMRSKLHKLKLSADDQKFFDEIFLSIRKKVQSITLEMNLRRGNITLSVIDDYDLAQTLNDLATAVNQYYGHDIVDLNLQDQHIFADCDANKLLYALLQLINNAVKMSSADKLPEILISLSQNDIETKISVSDNGVGFPDGNLDTLTEAYCQADNSFTKAVPGLGLGLYIVKKIVALHHGVLELGNAANGGAVVNITLPSPKKSGKGRLLKQPILLSFEEVKERSAFLLVDVPLNISSES